MKTVIGPLVLSLAPVLVGSPLLAQERLGVRPFTPEERAVIEARLLEAESVQAVAQARRVRVLSIVPVEIEKDPSSGPASVRYLAEATVVAYGMDQGIRVRIDPTTGRVVATDVFRGRPQSSPAEREEAEKLIRAHAMLGPILEQGTRLVGGFVIDPPKKDQPGRFLEYHIADAAGQNILREMIVDLATGSITASRDDSSAQK